MKLALCFYLIACIFILLLRVESSDVRTQWSFSFPKLIKALKNSDVTIPCTFTAPINHTEVNLIWFKYHYKDFLQVFNSKDPSKVIEEYRGRTSLVANGTDSCTLRIKDVTKTEQFYPGISEEINSYELNNEQMVQVNVTGCSEDRSCGNWTFIFPRYIEAMEGSCVEIRCTFTHPEDAKDYNFFWYSELYEYLNNNEAKIFNNRTPSDVADEYKGRTFLTGNKENDCSLKIINVQNSHRYFPGINDEINAFKLQHGRISVDIRGNPPKPFITGTENLEDRKAFTISCSVYHTCPSSPPILTWSVSGHPIMESHTVLGSHGMWIMESRMTYTASYTDDKRILECAATFPNNKTSVNVITLNIKYRPQNIIISVEGNSTQEGDNVTLLCSCQANPPVYNFSWYQIDQGSKLLPENEDKISVKNTTTGQYKCAATNEMGTGESSVFEFTKQSNNGSVILYAGIGTAVGLAMIFLLIVLFFLFRSKKTPHRPPSPQPSSDATYTSLKKREKEDEYATVEPVLPGGAIIRNTDLSKDNEYENFHHKT